jgi:hypothetical protein
METAMQLPDAFALTAPPGAYTASRHGDYDWTGLIDGVHVEASYNVLRDPYDRTLEIELITLTVGGVDVMAWDVVAEDAIERIEEEYVEDAPDYDPTGEYA